MPLEIRFHSSLEEIDAIAWDALLPDDNPFLRHAFLAGLERHGCLRAQYGWRAHHLALHRGNGLIGAAPLYLKGNSHGEFVFDWGWASAWERAGFDYYPKLLGAVPYSPVTGPRLLVARDAHDAAALRTAMIEAIAHEADRQGWSSAHINFVADDDAEALRAAGWLERFDWQFHWTNRGWRDFDEFLAALTHKKRKNIRHERAQVARAGVRCEIKSGAQINAHEWHTIHELYVNTFEERGNHPALTLAFLRDLAKTMPQSLVAVLCKRTTKNAAGNSSVATHERQEDAIVAMALMLRSATTLYGRYWGCHETVPGLHFEACYYQGIEYCLRHGLTRFEPGAQGEHKIARGFLPTQTRSFHYLRDARFRAAVAAALRDESAALHRYRDELLAHSPYAHDDGQDR